MPLAEETRRKIFMGLVIITLIAGAIFMIFAFFFNKGTLTINADPTYRLEIGQFKKEVCTENPCSVVVAPGDYTIYLNKDGYREYVTEVSVPIGGETVEDIEFTFIPFISEVGKEADLNYFGVPTFESDELPETYFLENNFAVWLEFNTENARQTLYFSDISGGNLGEKTVATSFIRPLKDYAIYPYIEDQNKILIVDNTDDGSVLYVVDLIEKTKDNVLSRPLISDIKWMKNSDNILLEARGEGEVVTSIFTYSLKSADLNKINIKTDLNNIAVVSDKRLIAATMQGVSGVEKDGGLDGQLVTLSEFSGTPDALPGSPQGSARISFIDYSLEWNEARLLKTESLPEVENVKLTADGKGIYFLAGGTVYELRFEE